MHSNAATDGAAPPPFRYAPHLLPFAFDDEGVPTATSAEQLEVEQRCAELLAYAASSSPSASLSLDRDAHVAYARRGLEGLSASYLSLDASRSWILYWILQALDILDAPPVDRYDDIVALLARCQHPGGGFGGGPSQAAHTAATYAAVLALCAIGTPAAFAAIDRHALLRFYCSVKDAEGGSGGFHVQLGGEMDVRGAYTVVAVAKLLNLEALDGGADLLDGTVGFLLSCQSWEGGFGGEPGNEAHGGYTFCAVAGLALLGSLHNADLPPLLRWLAARQLPLEGGFAGRTNKLVDACYSFWQGAPFLLLSAATGSEVTFDHVRLQRYILACCQTPGGGGGGLLDKPGKGRDFYHTCYALAGLSLAQQLQQQCDGSGAAVSDCVLGGSGSNAAVEAVHPAFNLLRRRVAAAAAHFGSAIAV